MNFNRKIIKLLKMIDDITKKEYNEVIKIKRITFLKTNKKS